MDGCGLYVNWVGGGWLGESSGGVWFDGWLWCGLGCWVDYDYVCLGVVKVYLDVVDVEYYGVVEGCLVNFGDGVVVVEIEYVEVVMDVIGIVDGDVFNGCVLFCC